jgi:hypothetical protein
LATFLKFTRFLKHASDEPAGIVLGHIPSSNAHISTFLGQGVTLQRFLPVMENDRSHYLLGNWIKNGKGFRERRRGKRESRIGKNEGNGIKAENLV